MSTFEFAKVVGVRAEMISKTNITLAIYDKSNKNLTAIELAK